MAAAAPPPLRRGCTFKKRRDGGFRLRRRPRWGSPRYSGRHRPPTSRSRTSGLVPLSPPLQTSSQPPRIRRSYRKTNTSKLGKGEHASPQCSLLQFPNRLASASHFYVLFIFFITAKVRNEVTHILPEKKSRRRFCSSPANGSPVHTTLGGCHRNQRANQIQRHGIQSKTQPEKTHNNETKRKEDTCNPGNI